MQFRAPLDVTPDQFRQWSCDVSSLPDHVPHDHPPAPCRPSPRALEPSHHFRRTVPEPLQIHRDCPEFPWRRPVLANLAGEIYAGNMRSAPLSASALPGRQRRKGRFQQDLVRTRVHAGEVFHPRPVHELPGLPPIPEQEVEEHLELKL